MLYTFSVREIGPQPIVSIRERHPADQMPAFLGETFGSLFGRLHELGVPPVGAPFVIYHEFGSEAIDAEVCIPVGRIVNDAIEVASRELPPTTVVRTVHVGPYTELGGAYDALTDWIRAHATEAAGPVRERYLNGPGDGVEPAAYVTEVEMPIVAERIAVGA